MTKEKAQIMKKFLADQIDQAVDKGLEIKWDNQIGYDRVLEWTYPRTTLNGTAKIVIEIGEFRRTHFERSA